ncbi:MAG: M48 family metallopeptidase [Candidatus Neomarinimicrobiota bacterium]
MSHLHPLLDSKKQTLAKEYETIKRKTSFFNMITGFVLSLIFILFVSQALIAVLPPHNVLAFIIFIWCVGIFSLPIDLIFSYISGYKLEHQYGFSNQNKKQFFKEQFKGLGIELIIGPLLAAVLFWAFHISPHYWWLWAAGGMILVSVIFATFYPVVIMPLFNKYTPIEDEELKTRLGKILEQGGLKIKGFFLQDMSRQTKKENAFLGGLGKTRRVVLSDNIISNMSLDELETVIAHEVGHYKYKHIWKNLFLGTIYQLCLFFVTHKIMFSYDPAYLNTFESRLEAYPIFLLCFGLLNFLFLSPLSNAVSRHFERQADTYALDSTKNPEAFQKAMAGLANRNLSNAYPGKFIKILYYSHPPIGERLRAGLNWAKKHEKA